MSEVHGGTVALLREIKLPLLPRSEHRDYRKPFRLDFEDAGHPQAIPP
jgi:hypothetical protein